MNVIPMEHTQPLDMPESRESFVSGLDMSYRMSLDPPCRYNGLPQAGDIDGGYGDTAAGRGEAGEFGSFARRVPDDRGIGQGVSGHKT